MSPDTIRVQNLLESVIATTPIPAAPIGLNAELEKFGLHLLASTLKLEHVSRISENLRLVDASHMSRRVSMDIDVSGLSAAFVGALAAGVSPSDGLWVPIERHSREALAPVLVRDGSGDVLPRQTGLETSRALAAGLARLFRLLVETSPQAAAPDSVVAEVTRSRFRSRWLVEAAIVRIVENGPHWGAARDTALSPSARHTDSGEIRRLAIELLRAIAPAQSPFHELLSIAASEYFLVVQVPLESTPLYVEYEAPLLPVASKTRVAQWLSLSWFPLLSSQFTIVYDSVVPRGVSSYHLTLELPQELRVRRFVLSSEAEGVVLDQLTNDMRAVADDLASRRSHPNKVHEAELQGLASRLAEIGRRKHHELDLYASYLTTQFHELQGPGPIVLGRVGRSVAGPASIRADNAFTYLAQAHSFPEAIISFGDAYESDRLHGLADHVRADDLEVVARRLEEEELRYDTYLDNDPRENAAHAQWRRKAFGRDRRSAGPVRLRIAASIADDSPSLSSSVAWLLGGLLALVSTLAFFLHGLHLGPIQKDAPEADRTHPFPGADAVVAILLLVPGLLLTRLDIPSHRTVLGRLRLLPRYLAYAGVLLTAVVSMAVASLPLEKTQVWFQAAAWSLVGLLTISGIEAAVRMIGRRTYVPRLRAVPRWLRTEMALFPKVVRRTATAHFSTVEIDPTSDVGLDMRRSATGPTSQAQHRASAELS